MNAAEWLAIAGLVVAINYPLIILVLGYFSLSWIRRQIKDFVDREINLWLKQRFDTIENRIEIIEDKMGVNKDKKEDSY